MADRKNPGPSTRPPMERLAWWVSEMEADAYPSLAKGCEHFEISERTARRDLEFLRDRLGAPCAYDRARNGYYYTERGFSLPAVRLSEGELLVLFVAETLLREYRGTPYADQLRATFSKLRRALPEEISVDLGKLTETLSFDLGSGRPVSEGIFTALQQAIERRRCLEMHYHTLSRDEETVRRVDPLHLHATGGDWYLIAFCHLRGEVREFALSRIRELVETGEHFVPPTGFDREDWLHRNFGLIRGGAPQEVLLRFDPFLARWIREREWHQTQRIEDQEDGGLILHLHVPLAADLVAWVLSHGARCQVLAPPELRDAVRDEARRVLNSCP